MTSMPPTPAPVHLSPADVQQKGMPPELDTVCTELPTWASGHGLQLLQGTLTGQALQYSVGPDVMTAQDFVLLAAGARAPFVYCQAEVFEADDFGPDEEAIAQMDKADRALLADLRRRARQEHGRCHELGLRFVAGGVVHIWKADASWWDQLVDELDDLEEKYLEDEELTEPEDPPSTPEEVDRIAGMLEARPDFREATKGTERERIVLREFPELRSRRYNGLSRLGYDAQNEAALRVAETSKKAYAAFSANLSGLAQEVLDAGVLDQATTAAARRAALRTVMQQRSGGYPPTKEFIELLYSEPLLKKPAKAASRNSSPTLWNQT